MTPAELVRRCREHAGVTQQQLAIRASTTKTAISRLESGHVSPTFDTLSRLLLCLGFQPSLEATRLDFQSDQAQLDAVAGLTPSQRLDHALRSQSSLAGLIGSARER